MTNKQKLFVKEYLIDFNATQSYIRAGYSASNLQVAASEGLKLLRKPYIQAEIQQEMKKREERTQITQDRVLKEMANLAFTDRTSVVNLKKNRLIVKDFDELTEAQKSCIAGVRETKHGIEVIFYNKEKALEMLGRHLGMFNDKLGIQENVVIISGEDDLEE